MTLRTQHAVHTLAILSDTHVTKAQQSHVQCYQRRAPHTVGNGATETVAGDIPAIQRADVMSQVLQLISISRGCPCA